MGRRALRAGPVDRTAVLGPGAERTTTVRLANKTVIITGGLGSQGLEEVRLCLVEGANVVCVDTANAEDLATVDSDPDRMLALTADVSDDDAWQKVVESALGKFGRIDVLVNNAGLSSSSFADEFDRHGWEQIIDVNLKGAFLGIAAVLPHMVQQSAGSIVNISSVGALAGLPGGPPCLQRIERRARRALAHDRGAIWPPWRAVQHHISRRNARDEVEPRHP